MALIVLSVRESGATGTCVKVVPVSVVVHIGVAQSWVVFSSHTVVTVSVVGSGLVGIQVVPAVLA